MLQYKLETLVAIKFQAAFRGLVGRNVAYGRVRHQENVDYIRSCRASQGFLLRLIGMGQRRTQRKYLRVVPKFGLDPISFVLSPSVQASQLREDFNSVRRELWVEIQAWRQGGFDYYHRDTIKRELMKKLVAASTVKQGDAVKIIAPRLPETGQTAYLMQLDRTVPGRTVAEVRMDQGRHDENQQGKDAFLPLVTDGDKYNPPVTAIKTIEKRTRPPLDVDSASVAV